MSSVNIFGDYFSEILKKEFLEFDDAPFLLQKNAKYSSAEKLSQLFPGKDKLWLMKELSKWKNKVLSEKDNFNPTLQNLFIFCTLTGRTPNEVLLPNQIYNGPDRIEYLNYSALESLVAYLGTRKNFSGNYIVPVLYSPEKMTASFLTIYSKKVQQKDAIYVQFLISSVEQRGGVDSLGGITSVPSIGFNEYNVSIPEKNEYSFHGAYKKMKEDFDYATEDLHSIITDEFYDEFGSWAKKLPIDKNSLLKYFPLPKVEAKTIKGRTLDEIFASQNASSISSEIER